MGIFSRKSKTADDTTKKVKAAKEPKTELKESVVKDAPKKENRPEAKPVQEKVVTDDKRAYGILVRPLISEKATIGVSAGKYVFEVSSQANKVDIKKAIKDVYGVMPRQINIVNQLGKKVRAGRKFGTTKNYKKAIITLKKGETIKLYEGI